MSSETDDTKKEGQLPKDKPPAAVAVKEPNRKGKQGPIICPGHSRPVPDLVYSPVTEYGVFLLCSCLDGKPMLRDGVTGDWIGTFEGHRGAVWCARFNGSATQVVTASAEFNCKLWDAITGDEIHTFQHGHIVKTVEFASDSQSFYSGGHEKKIRIFDLRRIEEGAEVEGEELIGHEKNITQIVQSPNEHLLFSAAEEPNIRVWDRRTLTVEKQLPTEGPIMSLEAHGDASILVSTSNRYVQFWDTDTLGLIKQFELPNETKEKNPLNCVSLDPQRNSFVTGSSEELWVRVWDYETGEEIGCQKGHHGPVRCVSFNPDGTAYASGSEDGIIRIWESDNVVEEAAVEATEGATADEEEQ